MNRFSSLDRIKRFANKLRVLGLRQSWRSVTAMFKPNQVRFPLAAADPDLVFASSTNAIRDYARRQRGQPGKKDVVGRAYETLFPRVFEDNGLVMRYSFFPALNQSKGLIVIFHGYLGFEIDQIRYSWKDFDLLLPLDNFGWKNLGAWFWGTHGHNSVETLTQKLIQKIRGDRKSPAWFCMGTSMGAFAALYHGIKYAADGVYVAIPIIDLKRKIRDYRSRNIQTSYTEVAAGTDLELKNVPDIYQEAQKAKDLPPLYLVQNQYDRSNPFGKDTLPLLSIYEEKKGWLGLRVHPAIGHQGHDGGFDEAQYFFNLITSKSPPRVVDFYDQE